MRQDNQNYAHFIAYNQSVTQEKYSYGASYRKNHLDNL